MIEPAEPDIPAWPGQETRDFSPVNQQQYAGELYGSSGYGDVEQTDDGLLIRPRALRGGTWHSYADHRMATAGAILGLRVPGIEVEDIATTSKTIPDFPGMWTTMLEPVS